MANRCKLAVTDLSLLKKYLDLRDIEYRDKEIKYQVIQINIDGRFHPIFAKEKTCRGNPISHYTITKSIEPVINQFLKWKKKRV